MGRQAPFGSVRLTGPQHQVKPAGQAGGLEGAPGRRVPRSVGCNSALVPLGGVVVVTRLAIRREVPDVVPDLHRLSTDRICRTGKRAVRVCACADMFGAWAWSTSAWRRSPRSPMEGAVSAPARGIVVYRWNERTQFPTAEARLALGEALARLGVGEEAREDAQLALSELVANAAEHACGPYEVRLQPILSEWVCEVEDSDPRLPKLPQFPPNPLFLPEEESRGGGLDSLLSLLGERGRGLQVVHQLTGGGWGFCRTGETKVAWFVVGAIGP
ncbi:ATP-binding protein [Streptomyces sp. CA-250714]|uniref:ATP-binding protein n=1 Tax=Streptomyces sp. CA-250714 TaxID=3240060 RepID=UPI003D8F0862